LVAAVVGGIVAGALGGAPLQVSGPAAGLTVIVAGTVADFGFAGTAAIVAVAGLVQITLGVSRLGRAALALSPAVVHGMLAGIGVLIFASQFHVMVDDKPRGSGIQNILSLPEAVWKGIVPLDGSSHHWAARIGILTIALIVGWKLLAPKKLQIVPATLIAVGVDHSTAFAIAITQRLCTFYLPPIWGFVSLHWLTRNGYL
jgi:carbonic anhydrase